MSLNLKSYGGYGFFSIYQNKLVSVTSSIFTNMHVHYVCQRFTSLNTPKVLESQAPLTNIELHANHSEKGLCCITKGTHPSGYQKSNNSPYLRNKDLEALLVRSPLLFCYTKRLKELWFTQKLPKLFDLFGNTISFPLSVDFFPVKFLIPARCP